MTNFEDINVLAAEFVLGTLEAEDRLSVTARRQREPALDDAIAQWEHRLSPLMETVAAVDPRANLFAEIEARIVGCGTASLTAARVLELEQHARRWRRLAMAAAALAACLLVVIGVRETLRPRMPMNYVAVFQKDDASPAFLLSVDLGARVLSVRRVAAPAQPGKTYQLWIASEKIGGAPQSLGLIDDDSNVTSRLLSSYDPAVVEHATFGISLEPAGGSPSGRPTGPAFHARLIPNPR